MTERKIPTLNQKFDLRTFFIVLRKMFWLIVLLLVLAIVSALAFFRYTKPLFEASAVIQIKTESKTGLILGLRPRLLEEELAPSIEIIRSNEFLKTCIDELPLDISYYNKGTFLSTELYKTAPYQIQYLVNNNFIYGEEIFIEFNDNYESVITYKIGNQHYKYNIRVGEWHSLAGIELFVDVNKDNYREALLDATEKEFYFVINNARYVLNEVSRNLLIQTLSESAGTILISYKDHNARKAADIVNTIAERFVKFDEEKKKEGAVNVISFIDEQIKIVTDQLNQSERDLHQFRQANQMGYADSHFLENKTTFIRNQINQVESTLFNLEIELMTLNKITQMLNEDSGALNIYELLALISGHQSERFISSMLNNILRLEEQKENLLFDVTANNHKIIVIDSKIENQKQLIIDFIRSTKVRLNKQKDNINSRLKEYERRLVTDPVFYDEIEYAKLLRVHSINEDFYSKLIKTKAETMIAQAGYVSDNLILERAVEPKYPVYPHLRTSMLTALVIAAIVSFIFLLIKYLFYNRIHSTIEISQFSDIPIIGGIPIAKKEMSVSQVLVVDRPKSMMAEAFRNVRTNLEFFDRKNKSKGRVITISSTIAGEGKTFIALNTAAINSMAGKKTIVLDLDLRRPRIHKSFDVDNSVGISNILIGKSTYKECLHETEIENFHYITSGPLPPNPAEIVLTDKLKNLVDELREEYDIIILDTPPIGIVTDALPSFMISDNPVYVMRAGVSPKSFIDNVNAFKAANRIDNLGIILNGVERSSVRTGYGYKTGYGYQYGYSGYGYGYGYLTKIHNNYYGEEIEDNKGFFKKLLSLIRGDKLASGFKDYMDYLKSENKQKRK